MFADKLEKIKEKYGKKITIVSKEYRTEGIIKYNDPVTGDVRSIFSKSFIRVEGIVHAENPDTSSLCFEVGIPENWNGKLVQMGGGSFCGMIIPVYVNCAPGNSYQNESFLSRGYAVCACDSGHQMKSEVSLWDSKWALDRETLVTFAYEQIIKTKEAALLILKEIYEKDPDRVYYYGGSEGGRETLQAIQRFPNQYDGAICFFPVLNWVMKAVKDSAFANRMAELGNSALLTKEDKVTIKETAERVCGGNRGNLQLMLDKKEEIFQELGKVLRQEQIDGLISLCEPLEYPFSLANGWKIAPGYLAYMGTGLDVLYPSSPEARDGEMMKFGDAVVKDQIIGDDDFNPAQFDIMKYQKEFEDASALLDATNADLTVFKDRGGKLLLVHGLADEVVTPLSTVAYYHTLQERYGEETDNFVRLYLAPGYGHNTGEFQIEYDFLSVIEEWVEKGKAPECLTVRDSNPDTPERTEDLFPYKMV